MGGLPLPGAGGAGSCLLTAAGLHTPSILLEGTGKVVHANSPITSDELPSGTEQAFGRQERPPCLGLCKVWSRERTKLARFRNPRAGRSRKDWEMGRKKRGFNQSVCHWWGWGGACIPLISRLTDLCEERRLLLEIINGLERGAGLPRHEAINGEEGAWLQPLPGLGCNKRSVHIRCWCR